MLGAAASGLAHGPAWAGVTAIPKLGATGLRPSDGVFACDERDRVAGPSAQRPDPDDE
jgi:hypothetical protein